MTQHSKNQINRAGESLRKNSNDKNALNLINDWRESHIPAMDTLFNTAKDIADQKNTIVAERLKRLPTILDKIDRYPTMRLSSMQDIGGVRAILPEISKIYPFLSNVSESTDQFCLAKIPTDYIIEPKNDGYRGVHAIYNFPELGLCIELQLRSQLQHIWATAIESMSTYLGQPFKTGGGDAKWREFFALVSSAFAYFEETSPVARHKKMGLAGVYGQIRQLDQEIGALGHIKAFAEAGMGLHISLRRVRRLGGSTTPKRSEYALISLDLKKQRTETKFFAKNIADKAMQAYKQMEKRGDRYDQVLVSVSKMSELDEAYPNYFLDLATFSKLVSVMLDEYKKNMIK